MLPEPFCVYRSGRKLASSSSLDVLTVNLDGVSDEDYFRGRHECPPFTEERVRVRCSMQHAGPEVTAFVPVFCRNMTSSTSKL